MAQAAGGIEHSQKDHRRQNHLTARAVQRIGMGKAGRKQTGGESRKRQQYAANQRSLAKPEEGERHSHNVQREPG